MSSREARSWIPQITEDQSISESILRRHGQKNSGRISKRQSKTSVSLLQNIHAPDALIFGHAQPNPSVLTLTSIGFELTNTTNEQTQISHEHEHQSKLAGKSSTLYKINLESEMNIRYCDRTDRGAKLTWNNGQSIYIELPLGAPAMGNYYFEIVSEKDEICLNKLYEVREGSSRGNKLTVRSYCCPPGSPRTICLDDVFLKKNREPDLEEVVKNEKKRNIIPYRLFPSGEIKELRGTARHLIKHLNLKSPILLIWFDYITPFEQCPLDAWPTVTFEPNITEWYFDANNRFKIQLAIDLKRLIYISM